MLDLGRSPHSLINTLGKESSATGITLLQQGPLPHEYRHLQNSRNQEKRYA
jgi:hypothetical protein